MRFRTTASDYDGAPGLRWAGRPPPYSWAGTNDHDLLTLCDWSVAVANAIPALRQRADVVTDASYGAGVLEVIHRLIDRNNVC
jgi:hypothetical protein